MPPRPVANPSVPNPPQSLGKKAAKKALAQAQAQAQAAAAVQAAATLTPANNKTEPNPRVVQNPPAPGPSRPPRHPKAPRGASAAPNNVNPVPAMENPTGTPPAEPSRRTRPVIGIASRQFEAALNIAGLANSASERRKREKDKVADTQNPANDIGSGPSRISPKGRGNDTPSEGQDIPLKPSSTTVDDLDPDKAAPSPPPSPKKEKSKRGGRVGASGRGSAPVKIPSILQRTDTKRNEGPSQTIPMTMQRSAPSGSEVTLAPVIPEPPAATQSNSPPPAGLGGSHTAPRGRGRPRGGRGGGGGRGRGGQPSNPRGGG